MTSTILRNSLTLIAVTLVSLSLSQNAFADDDQQQSCDSGKVLVSFVDGANVSYLCMDAGQGMVATVEGENSEENQA